MNPEKTQIEVTKDTREKLGKLRITKRESYDEVINRLLIKKGDVKHERRRDN